MTLDARWLGNLLLAVLVAGLAALAFWPGAEEEATGAVHTAFAGVREARTLVISNSHGRVAFERDGESWHMREPFQAPADPNIFRTLLDGLAARTDARYAASEVPLAATGLESPGVTLEIDGVAHRFGGSAPISYKRYVQRGDEVFLVEEMNHYRLQQPATYFVRRQLLPEQADISAIELPGQSLKRVDGAWVLEPEDAQVSADAIQRLVDAWRDATAMEVRALEADAAPRATLHITLADGTRLEFGILTSDDYTRFTRRDQGLVYEVAANLRKPLLELQRSDPAAALTTSDTPGQ